MKAAIFMLLVGAAAGGAGGWYAHVQYERHMGSPAEVLSMEHEDDRLVLVLRGDGRTFMATFRDRADDLASIVHVGDTVVLSTAPNVFADEPRLLGVRPAPPPPPPPRPRHRRGHEEEPAAEVPAVEAPAGEAPVDAGADHDAHPDLTF